MPFNCRRSGMILGSGGIGMYTSYDIYYTHLRSIHLIYLILLFVFLCMSTGIVLESEDGAKRRFIHDHAHAAPASLAAGEVPRPLRLKPFCCRLLGKCIDAYSVYSCLFQHY